MARIDELLRSTSSLSIELWPPKTPEATAHLQEALPRLYELHPTFASITYGAGGSTRERTHELVVQIHRQGRTEPMAHLAGFAHRRGELVEILERYARASVENVLALRGDPPRDAPGPFAVGELAHAIDLVELVKSVAPFCVAVAAHPEGHPTAPDLATDRRHLAAKLGVADFAITQFFFRVSDYLRLVDDLARLGVTKPVIPGIMPILNLKSVARMAELSGAAIPDEVTARVERVAEDPEAVRAAGIEIATELCRDLLAEGAPGLHFYTMNQVSATVAICDNLGLASARS
ncbi:MAG: methylenetetrahydrofolate reductase [Acidimicrobiales bacterium]|jgi:methylenetetrahydrofolate reductase (NADPH)